MKNLNSLILVLITLCYGCEKSKTDTQISLIDIIVEPKGENCSNGGYKIIAGIDINENNLLDDNEIQNSEYICHGHDGKDGLNSLITVNPIPAGSICTSGGYEILSGIDQNGNNVLEENEVQDSKYVCIGEFDQQIRFTLLEIPGSSNHGNGGMTEGFFIGKLEHFNKASWPEVDSAVFVTNIQTINSMYSAYAELYDLTNQTVINKSTVSTKYTSAQHLISENFIDNLPEGEIDLTIQLRSENSSAAAYISGKSYLFLYRK